MLESVTPTLESLSADFSNERKTLGLFGSGPIEMLAREMTEELSLIRFAAINQAVLSNRFITAPLITKGVDFGTITARPDGWVDLTGVRGVNTDLIVRPFHQNG